MTFSFIFFLIALLVHRISRLCDSGPPIAPIGSTKYLNCYNEILTIMTKIARAQYLRTKDAIKSLYYSLVFIIFFLSNAVILKVKFLQK